MSKLRLISAIATLFIVGAVAWAQAGPGRPAPGPPPSLVKVKDDLYILQNGNSNMAELVAYGGNATFYLTDAGVILVGSKMTASTTTCWRNSRR